MSLKLIVNLSDYYYFLSNNFIYLNRQNLNSKKIFMIQNSNCIELTVFKNYYLYLFKIFAFLKLYDKNRIKFYNIEKNKTYTSLFKSKKLKLFNNMKYFFFNKILNFEFDLRSLTIFFLFNSCVFNYSNIFYKNQYINLYLNKYQF